MRYILFLFLLLFSSYSSYSQVGINTDDPKASLDITSLTGGAVPNGLLVPRLTGDEIEAMTVASDHNSLLVYATDVSTAAIPVVDIVGFWYYDVIDSVWKPLNIERRKNAVTVNPDGSGDYVTLQEAYNKEAQKLYKVYVVGGLPVEYLEFKCSGNVGPLTANGAIPYIKVTAGTNCTIGALALYNTTMSTQGEYAVTENTTFINSYIKMNANATITFAKQLTLKKTLFEAIQGCNIVMGNKLELNQSSVILTSWETNTTNITFRPTSAISAGLSLISSSVKTGTSTTLAFEGANTFTNYILCDDFSFLSAQGTILANAPVSNAVVLSRQASKACIGTIRGSAIPSKLFQALTGGRIEHFRGYIDMSVSGNAFLASNGGEIHLGGDALTQDSIITFEGASATEGLAAVSSDGGDIKVVTSLTVQTPYTYTFNDYDMVLRAASGGRIISLGKLLQGTSTNLTNITPGSFTVNGSAIFTGS